MTDWKTNAAARSKAYGEKLKDPRWQKMRLQVLSRDEWCCQLCFNSENTLHVHHLYYETGKEPWDYPLEALVTLCESCHADETEDRAAEEKALLFQLRKKGFLAWDLSKLADGFSMLPDGLVHMATPDVIRHSLDNADSREAARARYFDFLRVQQEQKKLNQTGEQPEGANDEGPV